MLSKLNKNLYVRLISVDFHDLTINLNEKLDFNFI